MIDNKMKARDRLITARVRLQKEQPFFSYLVMALKLIEKEEVKTAGVDFKGNLYYSPSFIDKLNNNEVKTLLCHEVLHIALLHLTREGTRHKELWNCATDIIINNTLKNNGFEFGEGLSGGLVPKSNEITFFETKIKELDKKFAEEVYSLINTEKNKKELDKLKQRRGFDIHIFGEEMKNEKGEAMTEAEIEKVGKEWKQRLAEAVAYSKLQGNSPVGMERLVEDLLESKFNWKQLLYKYISNELAVDYSYNYPSKRGLAIGVYMPRVKKELIDISLGIDVSGSISKADLTEFLSEVVAIGKSFENIRFNIIFMDTEVNNHYTISNGQLDELLSYEIKGGGGTDFSEVYSYIDKEIPNTRLLIFFSDMFATFPNEQERKTIWVVSKNGNPEIPDNIGEVIRIE